MPALTVDMIDEVVATGASHRVDEDVAPLFQVGQEVRGINFTSSDHTRIPRYVRGKVGVIDRDHGVFDFPDTVIKGEGLKPQHCYSVKFSFQELWGADYPENEFLYIDLHDDYLETV